MLFGILPLFRLTYWLSSKRSHSSSCGCIASRRSLNYFGTQRMELFVTDGYNTRPPLLFMWHAWTWSHYSRMCSWTSARCYLDRTLLTSAVCFRCWFLRFWLCRCFLWFAYQLFSFATKSAKFDSNYYLCLTSSFSSYYISWLFSSRAAWIFRNSPLSWESEIMHIAANMQTNRYVSSIGILDYMHFLFK